MTPLDIAEFFQIPAEWPVNPDGPAADEQAVLWARRTRQALTPEEVAFVRNATYGQSMGTAFQRARGERLQAITDWVTCAFFLDDMFLGMLKHPGRVEAVLNDAVEVMYALPGTLRRPLKGPERGLSDVMERLRELGPPRWVARFQQGMRFWMAGIHEKQLALSIGAPIGLEAYWRIRPADIGVTPGFPLLEMVGENFLPEMVASSHEIERMQVLVCEAIAIQNDVVSLGRDRRDRDLNLILVLEEAYGMTERKALEKCREWYFERIEEFDTLRPVLQQRCAHLPAPEREVVHDVLQDYRDLFHGTMHAQMRSGRYRSTLENAPSPTGTGGRPAFLDEYADVFAERGL
ncbi:hypothetical protein ABZ354_18160 [Streptomyces sp. NPDC005925]|uniref:terpene synthase family protein n=1 Tax=Streptomyces sp. NPDC005925 TaxID=3157172 RepID=UPI0034064607